MCMYVRTRVRLCVCRVLASEYAYVHAHACARVCVTRVREVCLCDLMTEPVCEKYICLCANREGT